MKKISSKDKGSSIPVDKLLYFIFERENMVRIFEEAEVMDASEYRRGHNEGVKDCMAAFRLMIRDFVANKE